MLGGDPRWLKNQIKTVIGHAQAIAAATPTHSGDSPLFARRCLTTIQKTQAAPTIYNTELTRLPYDIAT